MTIPVQEFQIGHRVRSNSKPEPFIVAVIADYHGSIRYSGRGQPWYLGSELTLAPKRPLYVPSERRVIPINKDYCRLEGYRCETDAELTERHAAEWAEYGEQEKGE